MKSSRSPSLSAWAGSWVTIIMVTFFFGLHLHDDLFDDLRIRLINGSGGLIEEEDFRLQYHGPGQAQAVTLAGGEVESPVEYRTLFHSVDVKLVQAKTEEFAKKLAAISQLTRKGFLELKFREDFSIFIMLIFIGLGIAIFLLGRRSE